MYVLRCAPFVIAAALVLLPAAPTATACSFGDSGPPQTEEYSATVTASGRSLTVGVLVTYDDVAGVGFSCTVAGIRVGAPATGISPILVLS